MLNKFLNINQVEQMNDINFVSSELKERWVNIISDMPVIYEQDALGNNAIAYLHYFKNGCDWFIIEKDSDEEDEQHQAFGVASINQQEPEKGYISIKELIDFNVEFDLYWTPKKLKEINI